MCVCVSIYVTVTDTRFYSGEGVNAVLATFAHSCKDKVTGLYQECIIEREESIALAYHPCAKFSGGQARACGLALVY